MSGSTTTFTCLYPLACPPNLISSFVFFFYSAYYKSMLVLSYCHLLFKVFMKFAVKQNHHLLCSLLPTYLQSASSLTVCSSIPVFYMESQSDQSINWVSSFGLVDRIDWSDSKSWLHVTTAVKHQIGNNLYRT